MNTYVIIIDYNVTIKVTAPNKETALRLVNAHLYWLSNGVQSINVNDIELEKRDVL